MQRLVFSMMWSVMFLIRFDMPQPVAQFHLDVGYMAYSAMLSLHYMHNQPTLVVFSHYMIESCVLKRNISSAPSHPQPHYNHSHEERSALAQAT